MPGGFSNRRRDSTVPRFQQRHYECLASFLAGQLADVPTDLFASMDRRVIEVLARRLADRLADDNPRFQRSRFLRACGISE